MWDIRSARSAGQAPTQSLPVTSGARGASARVLHATWFPEAGSNRARARIATLCTNRQFGVHALELSRGVGEPHGPKTRSRGVGAYIAPPPPEAQRQLPRRHKHKHKHKHKHRHKGQDKDKDKGKGKGKGKGKDKGKGKGKGKGKPSTRKRKASHL